MPPRRPRTGDDAFDPRPVRRALLEWYDANKRDLPWRRTRDGYAIWVAEVMLQQTRVETVIPYYARFLSRFSDVRALADAPLDDVLASWSGLGYYRRARLLHAGAIHVRDVHGGVVPRDPEAIRAIPGVGAYTAGAIASQAFDLEQPIVDGNVARFVSRLRAIDVDVRRGEGLARAWRIATALVEGERPGALNNALMEIGATVCVSREPRCLLCPVRSRCVARERGLERDLPVAPKKAERPTVREIAAVLRVAGRDERVLLARCTKDGLFGGLWEPPRVSTNDPRRAQDELATSFGVDVELAPKAKRSVVHVLTHRRLLVDVHEGVLSRAPKHSASERETLRRYDRFELVDLVALDRMGVATLGRKLLGLGRAKN